MKTALSQLGQRTAPPSISWLMEVALSRPKLVSLAAGFTDNASLPVSEVREALAEILATDETGQTALQYGTTPGDAELPPGFSCAEKSGGAETGHPRSGFRSEAGIRLLSIQPRGGLPLCAVSFEPGT